MISPLYITKKTDAREVILLVHKNHFCVVKNESVTLRKQNGSEHHKIYICRRCMTETKSENALKTHKRYCSNFDYTTTIYPEEGKNHVEFRNFHKMHKTPVATYADFECFLERIKKLLGVKTVAYQKHKPSGFCLYVVRFDGKNFGLQYTGRYAGKRFTDEVEKNTQDFYEDLKSKNR